MSKPSEEWKHDLARVFASHGRLFRKLAEGVLRDKHAAEDACQDAFVKFLEGPHDVSRCELAGSMAKWIVSESLRVRRRRIIEQSGSAKNRGVEIYALSDIHFIPEPTKPVNIYKADRLLDRIQAWTPIKLREELLGDLREDVEHRREQGWTEKELCKLIRWQFRWALAGWLWGRMERLIGVIRGSSK